MNQELEFAKKIEEIRELAKEQGNVLETKQVEEAFAEIGITGEQLLPVFDYLKSKKIGVDEKVNPDDYLTEDEADYLSLYLDSLKELPEYTAGEKRAIYMAAMAGESVAKTKLIEMMLPDVADMAKLYTGQGMYIEDLIGEGNVALSLGVEMLGALESPDEVPSTLASHIMNAMEEALGIEEDFRKADDKMVEKVNRVAKEAAELASELGRKVTVDEIVAEGKLSQKAVNDAIRLSGKKIEDIEY